MAPDPGEFFDVRSDDRGADAPRGERDQQIVHDAQPVPEPASVAMQGPEDDPGTVEEIGGRGDQTLGRKGALDPIDRTTARRSSMSTTEERKRMARCARPETESACEHPAGGSR